MNFIESMQERYTTKRYDNSKKLSEQQIDDLKKILQLSPSSINSQPWKFVFVNDKKTKDKLASVSFFNEHKIKDCDTLVVFNRIDNIAKFENEISDFKGILPEFYQELVKPQLDDGVKAWFNKQVYLSLGVFLSACANMGIDSTAMEGIDAEKYDDILGLEDYKSVVAVAIGYRDEDDINQPTKTAKRRFETDKVIKTI